MASKKRVRGLHNLTGQPAKAIRARQRKRGYRPAPKQRGGGGTRG